jgi:GTP cyclohydrolase I
VNGRVERAVADLLAALGEDPEDAHLRETPRRVAAAYAEMLTPEPFDATTFANDGGYDELVVLTDIGFTSLCEHHLLPFTGVAHVGYLPGERIVGLSKLPRMVEHRSRRLQVQERLTVEIAHCIEEKVAPRGVGVVIEAMHFCMIMRGVEKQNSVAVTSCMLGAFREQQQTRDEFLSLIKKKHNGLG